MQAEGLLLLYIVAAIAMCAWGLRRQGGVFEYPFIAGVVWLGFILPQLIGVMSHPEQIPQSVRRADGIENILLVYVLCITAGFGGYLAYRPGARPAVAPRGIHSNRLFLCGCGFLVLALIGFLKLSSLAGGIVAFYSPEGAYRLAWQGQAVAFNFFAQLVYPGLACCLLSTIRNPSPLKWATIAAASLLPIAAMVFMGRRGTTAHFLLICGGAVFFMRGWAPSKTTALGIAVAACVAVYLAPSYRGFRELGGELDQIGEIDARQSLAGVVRGEKDAEVAAAIVLTAAVHESGRLGYGRGYYNRLVQNFVPRILTGNAFKDMLLVAHPSADAMALEQFGWKRLGSTVPTGGCDVFREFSYFGAALFFFFAYGFRALWTRASRDRSVGAQLLYLLLLQHAAMTITHSISNFVWYFVYMCVFIAPVVLFARERAPRPAVADSGPPGLARAAMPPARAADRPVPEDRS